MKKHLKTKILLTPILIASISTPLLISACASVSQYNLPIIIGGVNASPFSALDHDVMNEPDNLDKISRAPADPGDVKFKFNSPAKGYDSYLPDTYLSYTSRSKNAGTVPYGFTNPINKSASWNDETDDPNKRTNYDYG
jgi:hypothetical protein